jgi:diaminopimelate decarboxylase
VNLARATLNEQSPALGVGLRVNLDFGADFKSRFGLDAESHDFEEAIRLIDLHPSLYLRGLHFHSTQTNKTPEDYRRRTLRMISLVDELLQQGFAIDYLDLGGGMAGPTDANIRSQLGYPVPSYEDYAEAIGAPMADHFPDASLELILEPGLALTVNTLDFYARVIDVRCIRGTDFALVEGSFFNVKPSRHSKDLTVEHVAKRPREGGPTMSVDLAGYTCLEEDYPRRSLLVQGLEVDDFFVFRNVGAYTFVFTPNFIRPQPAIVGLSESGFEILRRSGSFDDMFGSFIIGENQS